MKINRLNQLFCATALGSVIFLAVGCSDKKPKTDVSASVDQPAGAPSALPTVSNPGPAGLAPNAVAPMAVAADRPGIASDGWAEIKDDTFAQRTHFSAGLQMMESDMDGRIASMNTKMGGGSMMSATMSEVAGARTNLQFTSDKMDRATADTWANDKNRVGQAWVRMQAACTKAQSS